MAQVITKRITKTQALDLVQRMLAIATPEHVIREGLHQQGFTPNEITIILYEAHKTYSSEPVREAHINPKMMALGLVVITITMTLIALMLVISSLQ